MAGGGRRGTDWEEARDFWIALGPRRSFGTVARKVGVSDTRVRFVARRDGWQRHADEVDAKALEQTKRRLVRSRAERNDAFLGLYDKLLDRAGEQVAKPDADVPLAVVPQFGKHAELILGEATERPDLGEVQATYGALLQLCVRAIQEGWPVSEFIAKVRELGGQIEDAA